MLRILLLLVLSLNLFASTAQAQDRFPKKEKKIPKVLRGTWVFDLESSIEVNSSCNLCDPEKIQREVPEGAGLTLTIGKKEMSVTQTAKDKDPRTETGSWTWKWRELEEQDKDLIAQYPCLHDFTRALELIMSEEDNADDLTIIRLSKDELIFAEDCMWVMKKQ